MKFDVSRSQSNLANKESIWYSASLNIKYSYNSSLCWMLFIFLPYPTHAILFNSSISIRNFSHLNSSIHLILYGLKKKKGTLYLLFINKCWANLCEENSLWFNVISVKTYTVLKLNSTNSYRSLNCVSCCRETIRKQHYSNGLFLSLCSCLPMLFMQLKNETFRFMLLSCAAIDFVYSLTVFWRRKKKTRHYSCSQCKNSFYSEKNV